MRKLLFGTLFLSFFSCTNDVFVSVGSENDEEPESFIVDDLKKTDLPKTWQSQLDFAKSEHGTNRGDSAILLVDYNVVGIIETEEQRSSVVKQIFSDSMSISQPFGDIESFYLIEIGELLERCGGNDIVISGMKHSVDSLVQIGMKTVRVTWKQFDRLFNTIAIVSDERNRVIHDNVASLTSINERNQNGATSLSPFMPRTMSFSENPSGGAIIHNTTMADSYIDATGQTCWSYSISMTSIFGPDGLLVSEPHTEASFGYRGVWSCCARSQAIGGIVGETNHANYIYAWGHSQRNVVSISFNNYSYEVNGAESAASGNISHSNISQ